jgi:hypothetical protein
MAYRLLPNGTVEADTLDEFLALDKVRKHPNKGSTPSPLAPGPEADPARAPDYSTGWGEFCTLIEPKARRNQREVLRLIKARGPNGAISLTELAQAMNTGSKSTVGGYISGITKNVSRAGLPANSVVEKRRDGHYKPGFLLLKVEIPKN